MCCSPRPDLLVSYGALFGVCSTLLFARGRVKETKIKYAILVQQMDTRNFFRLQIGSLGEEEDKANKIKEKPTMLRLMSLLYALLLFLSFICIQMKSS